MMLVLGVGSIDPFQGCFNFVAYTLLSAEMRQTSRQDPDATAHGAAAWCSR